MYKTIKNHGIIFKPVRSFFQLFIKLFEIVCISELELDFEEHSLSSQFVFSAIKIYVLSFTNPKNLPWPLGIAKGIAEAGHIVILFAKVKENTKIAFLCLFKIFEFQRLFT